MKYPLALLAAGLALLPISGAAQDPAWEQWKSGVPGVFDLGGPRSDGSLLVAGASDFYTLTPDGTLTRFAAAADAGAEPYFTVSPGLSMTRQGCTFAKDETYALRLHSPIGITRIDAGGQPSSFANLPAGLGLDGIAFDTVGAFGHSLLATGGANGKTQVVAVDCNGGVRVVTPSAPVAEGGIAVAPLSFGTFGGSLIAPDELSGVIWSVSADGTSHQVVNSGLPKGGDIGVESVAFVPPGFFSRGGDVYYADRATPGNPHPGTDHVLRLSSADLTGAGVRDGDLLAATEGGASMIAVRCDTACNVITVVGTPTTAHGEGHIAFTMNPLAMPSPTATARPSATPVAQAKSVSPAPFIALAAAVVGGLAAILIALGRRR